MQLINLTTVIASLALVSAQEHYQNVQQSCQTMGYCTTTNNDPLQCYNCQLDLSIKNQVYNQANGFTQGQSGFIDPQTPPSLVPTQVPQPSQSSDSSNPSSGSANPSTPTQSGDQPQPTPSSGNATSGQSPSGSSSGSQPSGSASSSSGNKSSATTTAGNNASMIGGSLVLGSLSLIASLFI